jgi:hypothetical protein
MAQVMREEMHRLNRRHLLAGQQAFSYAAKNSFPMDATFKSADFDIVNDHPLPNTQFAGKVFEMGDFMSKELKLADVQGFCRATVAQPRPVVLDEDNAASMYRDQDGWTIHRKRAWTALLNGCHYDYIDFSITVGNESGTSASRAAIRSWMRHLSEFMDIAAIGAYRFSNQESCAGTGRLSRMDALELSRYSCPNSRGMMKAIWPKRILCRHRQ